MEKNVWHILMLMVSIHLAQAGNGQPLKKEVLPTPEQVNWAKAEIGVMICLDMNIFAPDTYKYLQKETLPSLDVFRPSKLNTDQWIAAAKSAGAKYAILVAKHGTGFSLWPTKVNNYTISNTPWKNGKGDIVRDFIKSCKKYGVKPGIYYSANSSTLDNAANDNVMPDSSRKAYNKVVLEQTRELWTGYGKLFEIWFDGGIRPTSKGGVSEQIDSLIKEHQLRAILFQGSSSNKNLIRWVGNETGDAPYPMWSRTDTTTSSAGVVEIKGLHGNPDGNIWCPAEADFPGRKNSAWEGGWFWRANRDQDILPVSTLIERYYSTVGRNTNMLIGMGIDTSGQFPEKESSIFAEFGKEIRNRFAKNIAETKGRGNEFILKLGKRPVKVNTVVLREDIADGENIRKYSIEAWAEGKWKPVCEGISIGNKRIQKFNDINTEKLRLRILESTQKPAVNKFAVYYVEPAQ